MKGSRRISELLAEAADLLRDSGVPDSRRQARDLLSIAINKDSTFLIAHPEAEPSEQEKGVFRELVARRSRREPFQHIRGVQEFYRREFKVTRDVMIPRPETELIVSAGIELLADISAPEICEVGVGSGCILISLLAELPAAAGVGVDISAEALAVAGENSSRLGVAGRVRLFVSDVFASIESENRFDLIVSNPPYVPAVDVSSLQPEVRDYEPLVSLTDGGSGLSIIRRIIEEAPSYLAPGGGILLEVGFNQSERVLGMFDHGIWESAIAFPDLQGIPRMIKATLSNT